VAIISKNSSAMLSYAKSKHSSTVLRVALIATAVMAGKGDPYFFMAHGSSRKLITPCVREQHKK